MSDPLGESPVCNVVVARLCDDQGARTIDETRLAAALSSQELEALQRFRIPSDRRIRSIAWALRRLRAAEFLGVHPDSLCFARTPEGRPFVDHAPPGFDVNIAHAPGIAVIAVGSPVRLGVDAESIERDVSVTAVARKVFTPAETEWLFADTHSTRERFFALWTRKEAYLKALGTGFRVSAKDVEVTNNCGAFGVRATQEIDAATSRWCVNEFQMGTHRIALVTDRPVALGVEPVLIPTVQP